MTDLRKDFEDAYRKYRNSIDDKEKLREAFVAGYLHCARDELGPMNSLIDEEDELIWANFRFAEWVQGLETP